VAGIQDIRRVRIERRNIHRVETRKQVENQKVGAIRLKCEMDILLLSERTKRLLSDAGPANSKLVSPTYRLHGTRQ
jgi:hypothetical protein